MTSKPGYRAAIDVSSVFERYGGGVGYATAHLASEVKTLLGQENIGFFSNVGFFRDIPLYGPFSSTQNRSTLRELRMYRHLYREYVLPGQIRRFGAAVAHFPDSKVPRRMKNRGIGIAVTVNDMGTFEGQTPEEHTARHRKTIEEGVNAADIVITISDFTKHSLIDILDVDPRKIRTIYLGISSRYRPLEKQHWKPPVRSLLGLRENYFLSVGEVNERKNLLSLARAHRMLPESLRNSHPLVIAGRLDQNSGGSRRTFIDQFISQIDDHIILPGVIGEHEKLCLYNGCLAFVFPSKYEGFGLPVLEAMACGKPVVAGGGTAIGELHTGKALLLVEATPEEIRDAMLQMIEDIDFRTRLAEAGKRHAATFTWRNTALQTIRVYEEILRG